MSTNWLPRSVLRQIAIGSRHIFDLFIPEHILYLSERNTKLSAAEKREEDPEKEIEMLDGRP